ncbi:hypothetical protein ACN47E_000626 [Coniothyrium glycines]
MKTFTLTLSTLLSLAAAQTPTLPELIASQPDLSILLDALSIVPDFATLLTGLSDITILAPTNTAFEKLLAAGLNAENQAVSTRDPDGVSTLLSYHVINGTVTSADFSNIPTYTNTIFNQSYSIFDVIRTNVTTGQNVGYVLDGETPKFLSGELRSSTVVQADIQVIPGVTIHKIDDVLTIPLNLSDTLTRLPQLGTSAILGALDTAGAIDRVDANGESSQQTLDIIPDITVFVPVDAAFVAAASAFEGASLDTLRSVLTYHVIQGSVVFASAITNTSVPSVQGNELTLTVGADGTVYVDTARVILPNVVLSNGVAHFIDAVLNPATGDVDRSALNPAAPVVQFPGATPLGSAVPFTQSAITPSTTISIPALATTAQFVPTGNATVTTASTTASATLPVFSGGAGALKNGAGGVLAVLGAAMLL